MRIVLMGLSVAALLAIAAPTEAKISSPVGLIKNAPLCAIGPAKVGLASWYGSECQGNPTASGEPFNLHSLTAAQWGVPLGTKIRVTNLKNKKSVVLRVNDRGPSHNFPGRIVDVSKAAAERLGFVGEGLTRVRVQVVSYPHR